MSSTIAPYSSMVSTSNTITIPKIAQDTMLGIRSPPQHMLYNTQNVRSHSRKNSKDYHITTIYEEK